MRFFHKYIRKYGKLFVVALLILMLEVAVDLMLPVLLARIIDEGVAVHRMDAVLRFGAYMLLLTGLGALAAAARNIVSSRVSHSFGAELRLDMYRKIQSLTIARLDRFERASLITRLTNDVIQVQNFVNGMMRIFVKAPLLAVGSLIMAVYLDPGLSIVFAVTVPIVGALIVLNVKTGFPRFMKVQKALDEVNRVMREYLAGVRAVKAFNRYDYEAEKFQQANTDYQHRSVQVMRLMAVFNPAIMLAVNLGIVAVIWTGALWVDSGRLQVGVVVAFINYMTQILFSLMLISMVFVMFVRAKASAVRIAEVLAETGGMTWEEGAEKEWDAGSGVRFQDVSFAYNGQQGAPAIRKVSFACRKGETVGIIGSTGSGKSTLVSLIPRLYDATSGTVEVGGLDVRRLNPAKLREQIAIVPQKSVLFSGTIRDNIRWGNEKATDEMVERAARLAQAHDFIAALPEGYASRLGQRGVNLSGGQKQRLSIARALVRDPQILILDDCTSAVDVETESRIKEGLRKYGRDIICFIIAQRITSVMDADQIIVMDHGEIAGIGTHDELLRDCGVYREIYESQMGREVRQHG